MPYSPEMQAELGRLLPRTRASAISATGWYFGTSAVIIAMTYWLDKSWHILWLIGGLGAVLAAAWACYVLTAHRLRRDHFPADQADDGTATYRVMLK